MASTKLELADSKLGQRFVVARAKFEVDHPEYHVIVTCTYRSPEEQAALYAQGRTKPGPIVTQIDGVTKLSNHNHYPSRAIDFAVIKNGKVTWDEAPYKLAGPYFVAEGLIWGGNWKSFKDYPHVELPKGE